MIFEISTFKLAKISSKILDTKRKNFFVEQCYFMNLWVFVKWHAHKEKL